MNTGAALQAAFPVASRGKGGDWTGSRLPKPQTIPLRSGPELVRSPACFSGNAGPAIAPVASIASSSASVKSSRKKCSRISGHQLLPKFLAALLVNAFVARRRQIFARAARTKIRMRIALRRFLHPELDEIFSGQRPARPPRILRAEEKRESRRRFSLPPP